MSTHTYPIDDALRSGTTVALRTLQGGGVTPNPTGNTLSVRFTVPNNVGIRTVTAVQSPRVLGNLVSNPNSHITRTSSTTLAVNTDPLGTGTYTLRYEMSGDSNYAYVEVNIDVVDAIDVGNIDLGDFQNNTGDHKLQLQTDVISKVDVQWTSFPPGFDNYNLPITFLIGTSNVDILVKTDPLTLGSYDFTVIVESVNSLKRYTCHLDVVQNTALSIPTQTGWYVIDGAPQTFSFQAPGTVSRVIPDKSGAATVISISGPSIVVRFDPTDDSVKGSVPIDIQVCEFVAVVGTTNVKFSLVMNRNKSTSLNFERAYTSRVSSYGSIIRTWTFFANENSYDVNLNRFKGVFAVNRDSTISDNYVEYYMGVTGQLVLAIGNSNPVLTQTGSGAISLAGEGDLDALGYGTWSSVVNPEFLVAQAQNSGNTFEINLTGMAFDWEAGEPMRIRFHCYGSRNGVPVKTRFQGVDYDAFDVVCTDLELSIIGYI